MRWHRSLKGLWPHRPIDNQNRLKRQVHLELEELESRALLSANTATAAPENHGSVHPLLTVEPQTVSPQAGPAVSGYTPAQIQQAYGVSSLLNGGTNGQGRTIAIVDAYYDPNLLSDVQTFNTQFGLQQFNVSGGPTLTQIASGGGVGSSVSQDPSGDWDLETSLDVEWAHAIAPQANIVLVEAPDGTDPSAFGAVQYAATQVPGVNVVSMSWGDYENAAETGYDYIFQPKSTSNPNGANPGVTFVAASGDSGAGAIYPAASPYVLSVGGTSLYTTPTSSGGAVYNSEQAWYGSGGGPAAYEGYPSYQSNQPWIAQTYGYPYNVQVTNVVTGATSDYSARMTPDVAYNADLNTGYAVYDTIPSSDYGLAGGWTVVGGTSAGSPQWSAIVALADQQRVAAGQTPLDTNQVLTTLYNTLGSSPTNTTYTSAFHDITVGSNGYDSGVGYDLATGLGTPIVNNIAPLLANTTIPQGQLPTITGSGYGGVTGTSGGFGSSSSGFGSTSFFSSTSYYGFTAAGQQGGGLYASTGSISITPAPTGANALSGPTTGTSPISATNAPAGVSLALFAPPLTSSISTTDVAATNPVSISNNLVGNVSTLASASSSATLGSTATAATTASAGQASFLFGATGWSGSALSWRMSSLGLPAPQFEQLADELAGNVDDVGSDQSIGGGITSDGGDDSGGDWIDSDAPEPGLIEEGDAGSDWLRGVEAALSTRRCPDPSALPWPFSSAWDLFLWPQGATP